MELSNHHVMLGHITQHANVKNGIAMQVWLHYDSECVDTKLWPGLYVTAAGWLALRVALADSTFYCNMSVSILLPSNLINTVTISNHTDGAKLGADIAAAASNDW